MMALEVFPPAVQGQTEVHSQVSASPFTAANITLADTSQSLSDSIRGPWWQ